MLYEPEPGADLLIMRRLSLAQVFCMLVVSLFTSFCVGYCDSNVNKTREFCIDIASKGFMINGMAKPHLFLQAGETYTFTAVSELGAFPFALTLNTQIARPIMTNFVTGDNPLQNAGDSFSFTPWTYGVKYLSYQSVSQMNRGNTIEILNSCEPSVEKHVICVTSLVPSDGAGYLIHTGVSLENMPQITLQAGTQYMFQGIGEGIMTNPLSFFQNEALSFPPLNVSHNKPNRVLHFTPHTLGPSQMEYGNSHVRGTIIVENACVPSAQHWCFRFHEVEGHYSVNNGDGPLLQGTLNMSANVPYTMEAQGSGFLQHPLVLTLDDTGIGNTIHTKHVQVLGGNQTYPLAHDGDTIIFTPPATGIENIYYQSTVNFNMGGKLIVRNTCDATSTHICVMFVPGARSNYMLNRGYGYVRNGYFELHARIRYEFEAVGDFGDCPFTLGETLYASDADPMAEGVHASNSILQSDNDILVYYPPSNLYTTVFYTSRNNNNVNSTCNVQSGWLGLVNTCTPTARTFCFFNLQGDAYLVESKSEAAEHLTIHLEADKEYVFEIVGRGFEKQPIAVTESPNGQAISPYTLGIYGANPAVYDDDRLHFTPFAEGPSKLYYQSTAAPNLGGQILIAGACLPSSSHICVTSLRNDNKFSVNSGEGSLRNGKLTLRAGQSYTFEYVRLPDSIATATSTNAHANLPFQICRDTTCNEPVKIDDKDISIVALACPYPAIKDDDTFTMQIPSKSTITKLFYTGGGHINFVDICEPSKHNICVSTIVKKNENGTDIVSAYSLDWGTGAMKKAPLELRSGEIYVFEVMGNMFHDFPFALSAKNTPQVKEVLTTFVTGDSPCYQDNDRLIFAPRLEQFEQSRTLWYQSLTADNLGNSIIVCRPGVSCTGMAAEATDEEEYKETLERIQAAHDDISSSSAEQLNTGDSSSKFVTGSTDTSTVSPSSTSDNDNSQTATSLSTPTADANTMLDFTLSSSFGAIFNDLDWISDFESTMKMPFMSFTSFDFSPPSVEEDKPAKPKPRPTSKPNAKPEEHSLPLDQKPQPDDVVTHSVDKPTRVVDPPLPSSDDDDQDSETSRLSTRPKKNGAARLLSSIVATYIALLAIMQYALIIQFM